MNGEPTNTKLNHDLQHLNVIVETDEFEKSECGVQCGVEHINQQQLWNKQIDIETCQKIKTKTNSNKITLCVPNQATNNQI